MPRDGRQKALDTVYRKFGKSIIENFDTIFNTINHTCEMWHNHNAACGATRWRNVIFSCLAQVKRSNDSRMMADGTVLIVIAWAVNAARLCYNNTSCRHTVVQLRRDVRVLV